MVRAVRFLALALMLVPLIATADGRSSDRLTIELDPREAPPVTGEMIIATLRGIYGLTILREALEIPRGGDFEWVQLDRDMWSRRQVDGRSVVVMERRLALFPKRPGDLSFGPLEHRMRVTGAGGQPEDVAIVAEPIHLSALPYPGESTDATLSADVLELTDELSADPGALSDGATLTRTVRITTLGALPQMLPPRPEMREPWLITFAAPEERSLQITPEGPVSSVVWQWHLRPKTGEPGVLPEIRIPWFDTRAREMREAVIPAVPFGYASFGRAIGGAAWFEDRSVAILATAAALGLFIGLAFIVGADCLPSGIALLASPKTRRNIPAAGADAADPLHPKPCGKALAD